MVPFKEVQIALSGEDIMKNLLKESPQRNKSIIIREATKRDIPQIIAISQTTDNFKMSRWSNRFSSQELCFWIKDNRSLVIVTTLGSKILGYTYGFFLSSKWFYLDEFVVLPNVRGIGIGEKMYAYLREKCRLRGIQLVQGLVKESKTRALKSLAAHGLLHKGSKCIWVEDWLCY
jgi:GNAT superfamily N-acetyltransferase